MGETPSLMPLKHATETFLIVLLAVVLTFTGIVIAALPSLSEGGMLPWAASFALAVIYPLILSPVFRAGRADYVFRLLHWFPALLLALWVALQGLLSLVPSIEPLIRYFMWGWALPGVATGFFLLMFFCFRVLRRWSLRIGLLLVLFLAFGIGAVMSEQYGWTEELASVLWQGDWWRVETGTGSRMIGQKEQDKNLDHSEDPEEESYRDRLRAIEHRRERIARRLKEREILEEVMGESSSSLRLESSASSSSSAAYAYGQTSSKPTKLPSSGFGWGALTLSMLAAYCMALQQRTRKRTML